MAVPVERSVPRLAEAGWPASPPIRLPVLSPSVMAATANFVPRECKFPSFLVGGLAEALGCSTGTRSSPVDQLKPPLVLPRETMLPSAVIPPKTLIYPRYAEDALRYFSMVRRSPESRRPLSAPRPAGRRHRRLGSLLVREKRCAWRMPRPDPPARRDALGKEWE